MLAPEGLAGSRVEGEGDCFDLVAAVSVQVGAFGEVLAQQAVGVLVRTSLPGRMRIAEVDGETGVDAELDVLGHFCSLVPGERSAELVGEGGDDTGDLVTDGLGAVTGQGRAVLDSWLDAVTFHWWKMQQHREPGAAFDEGADR